MWQSDITDCHTSFSHNQKWLFGQFCVWRFTPLHSCMCENVRFRWTRVVLDSFIWAPLCIQQVSETVTSLHSFCFLLSINTSASAFLSLQALGLFIFCDYAVEDWPSVQRCKDSSGLNFFLLASLHSILNVCVSPHIYKLYHWPTWNCFTPDCQLKNKPFTY